MRIMIGDHEILSQESIKYLGLTIDSRLSYKHHLLAVSDKAEKINGALTRILPNIGGPQGERRRLISTVVDSVVLYAAPIWAEAKNCHIKPIAQVRRRSTLRVACAYRTVSEDAVNVIAGKLPIDIQAKEYKRLYSVQGAKPSLEDKQQERARSITEWQQRWERSLNGRWTYTLIPRVEEWLKRRHGEIDFFLTQILTNHGCFLEYLHRFKLADSPLCPTCPNEFENAEHVTFYCGRFSEQRQVLEQTLGHRLTAGCLVTDMCESSTNWDAVKTYATNVILQLQRAERERRLIQRQEQLQSQTPRLRQQLLHWPSRLRVSVAGSPTNVPT